MFWEMVSLLGEPLMWTGVSLILVGIYFMLRRFRYEKRLLLKGFLKILLPSFLVNILLVLLIKVVYPVPRPCTMDNPFCMSDPSFPSGHTVSITTAVTSAVLGYRRKEIILLYILPFLVAVSRVMLGVHTVADVGAGIIIGIVIPLVLYMRFKEWFRK